MASRNRAESIIAADCSRQSCRASAARHRRRGRGGAAGKAVWRPPMSVRVGFVGLGNIGMPMATRLVDAGLPTTVLDLVPARVAELTARGARAAGSPAELARAADVVGICVRDDADVCAVVLGDDGLLAGAARGT